MAGGPVAAGLLGCYVLPGGVTDPRPALDQARAAQAQGLGAVWVGERYDTKDLPSLIGAMSQVTDGIRLGAAVTHEGLRHPMVLASMAQTLQALSNGRFILGLGRSTAWRWRAYGARPPTLRSMADIASILTRLWAGETVSYSGAAGDFPQLRLAQRPDTPPPPLLAAAVGPKTLALAGRAFDGVILHPFLTPDAVRRSVEAVRAAAEQADRDPAAAWCVATVVVAPGCSDIGVAEAVDARAAGYLAASGVGDALVRANGWDASALAAFRRQPRLTGLEGKSADKTLSRRELADLARSLPPEWLPSASAAGSVDHCANRLAEYIAAGADHVILHGTTAHGLTALIRALQR